MSFLVTAGNSATGCSHDECHDLNNEVCQLATDKFTCTNQTASFSDYYFWPMLFFVDESYQKCANLSTCQMCAQN